MSIFGITLLAEVPWTTTFLGAAVTLALIMTGLAMFLAFYRLVRGPSLPDRVVAIDLIGTATVGAIAAYDILTE